MKYSAYYPINLKLLDNHVDLVYDVFRKVQPHKGAFIGVCRLEGSFLCDNPEKLFSSLEIGELLDIEAKTSKAECRLLEVKRKSGESIGKIPFADSVLPNILIKREIELFAYLEIKEYKSDLLELAVSIYCERY